jgi:hypothetical protein
MQHCGLIIDSTSKKHRGIYGLPRTQSIYAADKSIQFQMTHRDALLILPHRPPTNSKIETIPKFILTKSTRWSPTLLHNDDDTTSLLEQDVMVLVERGGTRAYHVRNDSDGSTRYVMHGSDDSTIASDDLPVFPNTNIFDLSQMELKPATCPRADSLPLLETVVSQSTSDRPLDTQVDHA